MSFTITRSAQNRFTVVLADSTVYKQDVRTVGIFTDRDLLCTGVDHTHRVGGNWVEFYCDQLDTLPVDKQAVVSLSGAPKFSSNLFDVKVEIKNKVKEHTSNAYIKAFDEFLQTPDVRTALVLKTEALKLGLSITAVEDYINTAAAVDQDVNDLLEDNYLHADSKQYVLDRDYYNSYRWTKGVPLARQSEFEVGYMLPAIRADRDRTIAIKRRARRAAKYN